jgi:hypothetical protein
MTRNRSRILAVRKIRLMSAARTTSRTDMNSFMTVLLTETPFLPISTTRKNGVKTAKRSHAIQNPSRLESPPASQWRCPELRWRIRSIAGLNMRPSVHQNFLRAMHRLK